MKKIVSLYQRNYETDRLVRDEVVPGAEWVLAGEGIATRKFDGACCMIREGKLFKRYDLPLLPDWANQKKRGYSGPWTIEMYKQAPSGWEKTHNATDENTGHWPGWLQVKGGPEDQWFQVAYINTCLPEQELEDGTYEAIGPHFQGNPERMSRDELVKHGAVVLKEVPRTFEDIRKYLQAMFIEGIVWHHPDGRMVKIKAKDFGIKRPKMTLAEFRDKVIESARESLVRLETREHRRRGCMRGLEIAATMLNAEEFYQEILSRQKLEWHLRDGVVQHTVTPGEFWEFRCATLQIDFVYQRMKLAYGAPGSHSLAAVRQYIEITGQVPVTE